MVLVFKSNIPQANDFISVSQRDIQGNFQDVFDIWGKSELQDSNVGDHLPLNNPEVDNRGKHKKITLVEQNPIPVPVANEAILYSEEQNTQSELFYIRNGDAAGNQLTSNGALSAGGLVLRAYVLFDFKGKIVQKEELDEDGELILVDCSFNVSSVVQANPNLSAWTINFTTALETENYMWIVQSFNGLPGEDNFEPHGNAQPGNGALYNNTITSNSFLFWNTRVDRTGVSPSQPATTIGRRMLFQAYTVAQ